MKKKTYKVRAFIIFAVLFSEIMYFGSYMMLLLAILQLGYGDFSYFQFAIMMSLLFKLLYVISKRAAIILNNRLREKTSQYIVI